jgi:hypothetical protein
MPPEGKALLESKELFSAPIPRIGLNGNLTQILGAASDPESQKQLVQAFKQAGMVLRYITDARKTSGALKQFKAELILVNAELAARSLRLTALHRRSTDRLGPASAASSLHVPHFAPLRLSFLSPLGSPFSGAAHATPLPPAAPTPRLFLPNRQALHGDSHRSAARSGLRPTFIGGGPEHLHGTKSRGSYTIHSERSMDGETFAVSDASAPGTDG